MYETEVLSIRIAKETKELLQKAAALNKVTVTDYVAPILDKSVKQDLAEIETKNATLLKTIGITSSLAGLSLVALGPIGVAIAATTAATATIAATAITKNGTKKGGKMNEPLSNLDKKEEEK
jgi:hypothetical protein